MKRLFLLILSLLICLGDIYGQVFIFHRSGDQSITTSHMIIYDDGGSAGNCSAFCDATLTCSTNNPQNSYWVKIWHNIGSNPDSAYVKLFDGPSVADSSLLFSSSTPYGTNGYYSFYSDSNQLTLHYFVDSASYEGFMIEICEVSKSAVAQNVQYQYLSDTSVMITWNEDDVNTHWVLRYLHSRNDNSNEVFADSTVTYTTVYADTNVIVITDWDSTLFMNFVILEQSSAPCMGQGAMGTVCPPLYRSIVGPDTVCEGRPIGLQCIVSPLFNPTYHWFDGSNDSILSRGAALSDTVVWVEAGYRGCMDTVSHTLFVAPSYTDTLFIETCDESYTLNGFNADTTGFYSLMLTTYQYGCDSIKCLDLIRWPVFRDTIEAEIYSGDIYTGYGFYENEQGMHDLVFPDIHKCDSTYTLDLTVTCFMGPNAVTPNGDGINDVFDISGWIDATIFDHNSIWIYSRDGRLVFKGKDMKTKDDFWDPNKTNSPDGTYFYRFQARNINKSLEHNGVIEVLR